ncbi:BREX-1 system phosphatase PglZ type A [Anaeromicropila populeti]|uniref:TIGR02687 family protein n=1 Tax=Anaeromicropila populeti TaxID=37658 RepID=A0A1I6M0M6_9FIRM|nr:BREX-1 system phosphatase PglZ type A [Anaeromicropila populeti]SFS09276.1 TIGR02687 family protein [Anaeromicropila populeti]
MASMDLQTITQDLNRRFAAPLPEFYKRRIIFWYDEDLEFEDKLDELELDNASVLALTGTNNFAAKKLLAVDDTTSNYLVYCPVHYEKPEDNWLINIEMYSEEFRADLNSIWMDEMGLPNNPTIRKMVKGYRKFFNNIERRKNVAELAKNIGTASQLHLAVMAQICGVSDTQPSSIMQAVLAQSLDIETNTIYQEFVKYGAQNPFWVMVSQATGYSEGDDCDLGRLATHILLTATTRTMRSEHLAGLDAFISTPHQSYCYDMVSDWLQSSERDSLYHIARFVEDEARLPQRFLKLGVDDLANTECFPCINECILTILMKEISDYIINVDAITAIVEKRRAMVWYDHVSCYYEGLLQVANMQAFYHEHAAGFHLAQAKKVWDAYTSDYYKMDAYYRQFHLCFGQSLTVSNSVLDDLFKHVVEKVEGLYNGWFLGQLGSNWSNVCAEELADYGRILEVDQQEDFYRSKVKSADNKVYVIISDALRYEVAASLADQLRRETQSKVSLDSMEAIFPTITKFGMAALLPHKELSAVQKTSGLVSVLADGQSTDSNNRDKLLKGACGQSVALQYKNIIGMKRAERSALVKGMDVVYIYHDKVDEASHTADSMVFPACEDAITEIKNLVRIICNEFGGTRIYITADHGFLYTYSPLTEDDKVDKTGFVNRMLEYGRRFCLMQQGSNPDYLMPVKFLDGKSEMEAYAPRENVRIKMSGGGLNFVHGGISLQEMVVPVIEYQYLRNAYKSYQRNKDKYDTKPVEVSLLSATRKIVNMLFSLNFYQKEAVGDNRSACNYLLYFVDSNGKQISDTARIIADKTSDNGQERTFRCSFNLKSLKYSNQDSYYLVIADESGLQAPQREEFQIDIAFALDEFNFFG